MLRDSPSWSPKFVDQLVGDRIHRELMDFTDKVRRNPNHELRQSATRFLFEFADDLQNDPLTIAKAESVKEQLMARDEVTRAAESAWKTLKRLVLEAVDDPESRRKAYFRARKWAMSRGMFEVVQGIVVLPSKTGHSA